MTTQDEKAVARRIAASVDGTDLNAVEHVLWRRLNSEVGKLGREPELTDAAREDLVEILGWVADDVASGNVDLDILVGMFNTGFDGHSQGEDTFGECYREYLEYRKHIRRRYLRILRWQRDAPTD